MRVRDYFKDEAGMVAWKADTARHGAESRAAVLALMPDDTALREHDEWWPEFVVDDPEGREWLKATGFLYLIEPANARRGAAPVKIGFTARHPLRRLCELQRMSPTPLQLWAVVPASREHEAVLHKLLSSSRTHGEWFLLDEDVYETVSGNFTHLESLISSTVEAVR